MLSSPSFSDELIPDPIKLLRRLASLELRIDQLRRDCIDVADGRREIALAVTGVQVDNVRILRQVSDMIVSKELKTCARHADLIIFFIHHDKALGDYPAFSFDEFGGDIKVIRQLDLTRVCSQGAT
jgi:hypothetical protein